MTFVLVHFFPHYFQQVGEMLNYCEKDMSCSLTVSHRSAIDRHELSLWQYYELYKYLFFEACGYCAASWEDLSVVTGTAKASFVSCKGLLLLFVDSLPTKNTFFISD